MMEKQLFTSTGWDQQDTMDFTFYEPTLVRDIGPFKKGHQFRCATVSYVEGWVEFEDGTDGNGPTYRFKLFLVPNAQVETD